MDAARNAAAKDAARQAEQKAADAFTFEALMTLWAAERLAHRKPAYQREAVRSLRVNLAGLLTIDLPETITHGQVFNILVRRLTSRRGHATIPPPPPPPIRIEASASPHRELRPRHPLGSDLVFPRAQPQW